ncbi:MAG: ferrous iron transport protein B [Bacteroidales bacterium]|nr:ferrous iron transport protein B [Bacteroidales bacterium]
MTLAQLKEGEKAIIIKVKGRGAFRKRIMEMGFVVGKQVIVVRNAPLLDPIDYNIMGYEVSLRRSDAELIEVTNGSDLQLISGSPYYGVHQLEQSLRLRPLPRSRTISVALVGNPNCGKTTLFNVASGSTERTANYGGVTVESKSAKFRYNDYTFNIVDLPGTYSITHYTPEELFVRNHIFTEVPDIIVNVIDSSNIERNLYLTTQLIDMDVRVVIALNMFDELTEKGDKLDYENLGKLLGIPIVPTVSSKNKGVYELFDRIIQVYEENDPSIRHVHVNYGTDIENAIKKIQDVLNIDGNQVVTNIISPRYLAIKLLEGDSEESDRISQCVNKLKILETVQLESKKIENVFNDTIETIITDAKYGFIEGALKETFQQAVEVKATRSRIIDKVLTNRILSYPIFVFLMWIVFQATFLVGDYPMQWIDMFISWLGDSVRSLLPDSIIRDLLVDGIIGGVGGVIIFLPNILILFFFLSLMETTGYMARVAFIVDKLMHKVGLHGRSFIPLLMGFGCNVPAVMATRTIENRSDRLVTMMIIPFMSCSARYPVYILIISAFFADFRGTLLFLIYLIGIMLAALLAWLFRKTLFKIEEMPFVMELPPYRIPTTKAILRHTWFKGAQYLKKMGSLILIASAIVWALGYFPLNPDIEKNAELKINEISIQRDLILLQLPADDSVGLAKTVQSFEEQIAAIELRSMNRRLEQSFIGRIGHFLLPVVEPLGFDWKMGVSLLAGSAAKEIVISTMGVLHQSGTENEPTQNLISKLRNQRYEEGPKADQHVMNPLVAFSFMIFVLIYFPCIAVFAAIKKESGQWRWATFTAVYTTVLAWLASFAVFQIGSMLGF